MLLFFLKTLHRLLSLKSKMAQEADITKNNKLEEIDYSFAESKRLKLSLLT